MTEKTIDNYATDALGKDIVGFPNSSKTFVLFVQKNDNPARITKGLVFEVKTKKIIETISFLPGYAKWIDDLTIEVFDAPEVMKGDQDNASHTKRIIINKKELNND